MNKDSSTNQYKRAENAIKNLVIDSSEPSITSVLLTFELLVSSISKQLKNIKNNQPERFNISNNKGRMLDSVEKLYFIVFIVAHDHSSNLQLY